MRRPLAQVEQRHFPEPVTSGTAGGLYLSGGALIKQVDFCEYAVDHQNTGNGLVGDLTLIFTLSNGFL
jgi:hypothetical protein